MDVDPCNPADEKMTTTAMLQSSTFTSDFPSECFGHICSFMDLRDVLNFGSCSLSSTQQILPELCHRRKRMTKRFAYWRDWKIISALETNKIGIWDEVKEKFPNMNWVLIPTVQESVDELCKRMPSIIRQQSFGRSSELSWTMKKLHARGLPLNNCSLRSNRLCTRTSYTPRFCPMPCGLIH
jgi:hypothetical protein